MSEDQVVKRTFRELLSETKDGDWGQSEPKEGFVPYRVIRGGDFEAARLGNLSRIPLCYLNSSTVSRRTLRAKDILLETAGGTKDKPTGRSLLITQRILDQLALPTTCASFARFLRVDPKEAVPEYVFWFLQHMYQTGEMWQHQVQHTGVARFQFTKFADSVNVPLPPKEEQRVIAHILGTLDDKIELNCRMNETLEAIARAIFQSWFVDFDPVRAKASGEPIESICQRLGLTSALLELFPDALTETEMGPTPKGWPIEVLGELCDRVAMGPFGSDIKTDNFVPDGVPIIRGGNLKGGFGGGDFVFLTEEKADQLRNANAFPGDIVLTHRGTLGQVGLIPSNVEFPRYVISQSQMLLSVTKSKTTARYVYEYLRSPQGQHAWLSNTSQVGVPAISRPTTSLKAIRLLNPAMPILQAYELVTEPLFAAIRANNRATDSVSRIRDALLPQLLSGALSLPTLEGSS